MRRSSLLACLLIASCGKAQPSDPAPHAPPAVEKPLRTGIVEGAIRVDSDDLAPLMASVKGYEKYCGAGPIDAGLYKVDPATRGLAEAFVEPDGRSAPFKSGPIPVLDQKACLFTPATIVVPPGPVLFKNSDRMAHNVTIRGQLNPVVNEGFGGGEAISRTLPFDEKLTVRCSVHPWMVAGVVVTSRAAHALTDAAGRFRIEGVEAGRRKITVWHPLGEATGEIEVPPDGTARIEIAWKPRPNFRAGFGR